MEEIKQFKSLDDLKKIISDLEGFMARPVTRGDHPTIYPDVADGQYRRPEWHVRRMNNKPATGPI